MNANIAVIDKCPSTVDYKRYFKFDFDLYHLSSVKLPKVFKKDIDLEIDVDDYEFVILVGSESAKHFAKVSSVTEMSGQLVDGKFIPLITPAMLVFKPEAKPEFDRAIKMIDMHLAGEKLVHTDGDFVGIEDSDEIIKYLTMLRDERPKVVALDTEGTSLYPRDGYVLGLSISTKVRRGAYLSCDFFTYEAVDLVYEILDNAEEIVFHNGKYDLKMIEYHLGINFDKYADNIYDTLIEHYVLDETQGTHGLKQLVLKFLSYGNYDKDLDDFKVNYCKQHKLKKDEFNYSFIPFDIISKYAAIDAAATLELHINVLMPAIRKNPKLLNLYRALLIPGMLALKVVEENGIPLSKNKLHFAKNRLEARIRNLYETIFNDPRVIALSEDQGKQFNPNSVQQLRKLLYDYLKLPPISKFTSTGAYSTDSEVLELLSVQSELVAIIAEVRKLSKIKNTYVDKMLPEIDRDGCIRTFFNLTSTTSGRLSSSGKFNAQQIIRDDPIIKGCIEAPPGYLIVSQDLKTAEMYYAAALSKDKGLMEVFSKEGDFHGNMAKLVYNLDCDADSVKSLYPKERQGIKTTSFGILYGSGPDKVASMCDITLEEAKEIISDYYRKFRRLKAWMEEVKEQIMAHGFIYSAVGRKRRVPNVRSVDKGIAAHEVRSAFNFLIQSVSSDINLLATIAMQKYIKATGMDAKIFMLVHDSIVAVVREDQVPAYCKKLKELTQQDYGFGIPGIPIGVDQEIGVDYSMGKFDKVYGTEYEAYSNNPEISDICDKIQIPDYSELDED